MPDESTAPSYGHMPTEFPAEAAAVIGRAIMAKKFTLDLVEPLYDLVGYGLRMLVIGGGGRPVFGAGLESGLDEDAVGQLLIDAAEGVRDGGGPNYAASPASGDDPATEAVPWAIVLPILMPILSQLVSRLIDRFRK